MKSRTIVITGGHLTPAIATIEELLRRDKSVKIVFVGRSHAMEGSFDLSHEKEEMDRLMIPFYPIITGRVARFISIHSIVSFLKIPVGFFQAFFLCVREKPSCIVSFGGYVALPVVLSGWVLNIPIISHEQTSKIGLANRIIIRFAKKICVTFPEILGQLPKAKGVYTGLPVRKKILTVNRSNEKNSSTQKQILYVTGGSTGATSINSLIFMLLPQLIKKYFIIHQTGRVSYADAVMQRSMLPDGERDQYVIHDFVSTDALIDILKRVTIVVGRSGANTTVELATLGIPAVLIPLPWSGNGEQLSNAQWLASKGSARIVMQSDAPSTLLEAVNEMSMHISKYQKHAALHMKELPRDGAARFVDEIFSIL